MVLAHHNNNRLANDGLVDGDRSLDSLSSAAIDSHITSATTAGPAAMTTDADRAQPMSPRLLRDSFDYPLSSKQWSSPSKTVAFSADDRNDHELSYRFSPL
ncbi:hypothetical protein FRC11_013149, partial [Ceratobasidium sp. 423]